MNEWLFKRFEENAADIAIVANGTAHTYGALFSEIHVLHDQIAEIISPESTVVIRGDFTFCSIALLFACLMRRLIVAPVIPVNEKEDENKLRLCGADYVIEIGTEACVASLSITRIDNSYATDESLNQNLFDNKHSGLVLFSSGSTGEAKAMLHDLTALVDSYENRKHKTTAILLFLLFDHIGGISTLLSALAMGAKVVIPGERDVEHVASLVASEKVAVLPVTPTFINLLIMSGVVERYDLGSLRLITYGTEAMPESVLARAKKVFPRVMLMQTFGTSETGIARTQSRSSTSLDIKIDKNDIEYKVVDDELWLKGKTQVLGYLNAPNDRFTEDGWFRTGDIVEMHEDGYLRIIGRSTDIINVGGEKLMPIEVETVVMSLEGINECMAYGVKNTITGESVVLDVVKAEGCDAAILKRAIRTECHKKLARFKQPTKINFVDSIAISSRFKKLRKFHGKQ